MRLPVRIFVRLAFLVALLVAVAAPRLARAEGTEVERKRHAYSLMVEGQSRFDLGKFDEAIALFQNAYEVYPYPEALYSIAQAYRMKKDYEQAVFFYKSYLRNAPRAANRESVEARITELENLIAQQKASAQQPPQGVAKPPMPPASAPPASGPSASAPSASSPSAHASSEPSSANPPPAAPAAAAPKLSLGPETPSPWYRDTWGWTLVASGAVVAGAGAYLVHDAGQVDCPPGDQLCAGDQDSADTENVLGWTAVGMGGAALVLGIVKLSLTETPRPQHGTTALVVGPRYLGVLATF